MEERYQRTSSDVREVIKFAKLQESDLTSLTQVMKISANCSNADNYKFLQLDRHLEEEILNRGIVQFKGDINENAVLCTSSRTYDIKEAETSNSLLLVPDLLWAEETKLSESTSDDDRLIPSPRKIVDKDILKIFYAYFEARPCKPNMRKLRELLQLAAYSGPEREYAVDQKSLFSFEDLKCTIRASDEELLQNLFDMKAIKIDGRFRVLSFDYEFRALSQMLDLIEENSWQLNRIRRRETVDTLKNLIPEVILDNLFEYYTSETDMIDGEKFYKYDDAKVSRIFAQYILKDVGRFNLNDFIEVWKNSVPEGMTAELNMLSGVALYDNNSNPPVIWAFHESRLPENINDRLALLFHTKEKWTVEEMSPYIEIYTTDKLDVNGLLTKYARGSTQNGIRYYSAKHSK